MNKKVIFFFIQSFTLFLVTKYLIRSGHINFINSSHNTKTQKNINIDKLYDYTIKNDNSCSSLGKHAWAVLHSIAASYPNKPRQIDKSNFSNFFSGFIYSYPSNNTIIKDIVKQHPLEQNSREELVYYICDIHNILNKKLGKKTFRCGDAFNIWGGDCGCDS